MSKPRRVQVSIYKVWRRRWWQMVARGVWVMEPSLEEITLNRQSSVGEWELLELRQLHPDRD